MRKKEQIIEILTKYLFMHETENWSGEIIQDHQFEKIAKDIIELDTKTLPNNDIKKIGK